MRTWRSRPAPAASRWTPGFACGSSGRCAAAPTPSSAVYHSHPDGVAEPSATDLSMVFEPDLVWVITAVGGGKAGPTRAFRAKADRSAFLPVEIALAHRVGG